MLRRVQLDGKTSLPESMIRELVKPLEGRMVSLEEIENLRQALTRAYIERGYINSGAVIPKNGYRDGVLRIRMEEGRLARVRVHGNERLRAGYISHRLLPEPAEPLHLPSLQERFQMLLSDPLIRRMNGRILPGITPGSAILDVDVVRDRPYQLTLFGDNYRPPSIGAEAFGTSIWVRNLTGLGDLLDFTFTTSDGSDRFTGGFRLPIGDLGTEAYVRFDEGDASVVEEPVDNLDIRSQVHTLEGAVTHPFINSLRQRLNLGVSFNVRENETELGGRPFSFVQGEPSGRNQATVLRIFQDFQRRWDADVVSFRSTFSVGLNALGATPRSNPDYPSSEFFAWLGQAQYAHRFTDDGLQVLFRGMVQLSDAPLLPLEQVAVGGVGTVRGYRENELVRDQGYALSGELHIPVLQGTEEPYRLVLVPFLDYGAAWNLGQASKSLTSIGIGFNADYRTLHGELYYGYALDRTPTSDADDLQDQGIHFQGRIDAF